MGDRIKLGMVGGGIDAFIGNVHRIASRIDDKFELVAGALSSTPEKSLKSGLTLGIKPNRIYEDFKKMALREARLSEGIEVVSIVTPNNLHYEVAKEFLKRGIHVICDKPLTSTLTDAKRLIKLADATNALFILTHNYTGYPLVRHAKDMIQNNLLGKIRVIQVEYPQDWLTSEQDSKQANWRTDPLRSGSGGCIGDIGTHAFNLIHFVTELELDSLSADLTSFVPGRQLDDNAHVMLRYKGGAKGMLWSSQVAPGNENSLKMRIYGEIGGLEWLQEDPNKLWHSPFGQQKKLITRNGAGVSLASNRLSRIPAGHPEGYLEGFANIYSEAADAIKSLQAGKARDKMIMFPDVKDGLKGVEFVDACVRSSKRNSVWIRV